MKSGHPWPLIQIVDGKPPAYPYTEIPNLPDGHTGSDIRYVIGGYNWKALRRDNRRHELPPMAQEITP